MLIRTEKRVLHVSLSADWHTFEVMPEFMLILVESEVNWKGITRNDSLVHREDLN